MEAPNRHGELPDYGTALAKARSRLILRVIAEKGGVSTFSEIKRASKIANSVVAHHLSRLQALHVIVAEAKGTYRLTYRTPLSFLLGNTLDFAYLGLLGRKGEHEQPETKVARDLLEKEGIEPRFLHVLTTLEALRDWGGVDLPCQWTLCNPDELISIDSVKKKVLPQLEELMKEHVVILDCTSATKPATIAYYELAQTFRAPLIYVYEDTKELQWLISKRTLSDTFNI